MNFEEFIFALDDSSMQCLIKELDRDMLARALNGVVYGPDQGDVGEGIFLKVTSAFSKRKAAMFKEDIQYMGPISAEAVEEARQYVMDTAASLEKAGEIALGEAPVDMASVIATLKAKPEKVVPGVNFYKGPITQKKFTEFYYYYALAVTVFGQLAYRDGLLAMEEEIEDFDNEFIKDGLRMLVDGVDGASIRLILTNKAEREKNSSMRKIKLAVIEGILGIQQGMDPLQLINLFPPLVKIKGDRIAAACAAYNGGNLNAFQELNDFFDAQSKKDTLKRKQSLAALLKRTLFAFLLFCARGLGVIYDLVYRKKIAYKREVIHFIIRATAVTAAARRDGLSALKNVIDQDKLARRDIFDYGLSLAADGGKRETIAAELVRIAEQEKNRAQKQLCRAKREAVLSIIDGDSLLISAKKLVSFFGEDTAKDAEHALLADDESDDLELD
jgi:flagellar motor component MotA